MGIELYPKAIIPKKGLLKRPLGRDALFSKISEAVWNYIDDDVISRYLCFSVEEHVLFVDLHPAAQAIEFTWSPSGKVEAMSKTSATGPGFHAFVVDLITHVGNACGFEWDWQGADETDYAVTKNVSKLCDAMTYFLQKMAKVFVEEMGDSTGLMANMPIRYPRPVNDSFCLTPFGPYSLEWWKETAYTKKSEILNHKGGEFFSWWNIGTTSDFYNNFGLVLLWSDVTWHPPVNDEERNVLETALKSFEKAKLLQPDIKLPRNEIQETRALLNADIEQPAPVPQSTGIGYRRLKCRFPITGQWTVDLPGYFFHSVEDDGAEYVYWYINRTVRLTSFTLNVNGMDKTPEEVLANTFNRAPEGGELICYNSGHIFGRAIIERTVENDDSFWMLSGKMATYNSSCIITICYDNDGDKDWAIETFKSLMHPLPHENS